MIRTSAGLLRLMWTPLPTREKMRSLEERRDTFSALRAHVPQTTMRRKRRAPPLGGPGSRRLEFWNLVPCIQEVLLQQAVLRQSPTIHRKGSTTLPSLATEISSKALLLSPRPSVCWTILMGWCRYQSGVSMHTPPCDKVHVCSRPYSDNRHRTPQRHAQLFPDI